MKLVDSSLRVGIYHFTTRDTPPRRFHHFLRVTMLQLMPTSYIKFKFCCEDCFLVRIQLPMEICPPMPILGTPEVADKREEIGLLLCNRHDWRTQRLGRLHRRF